MQQAMPVFVAVLALLVGAILLGTAGVFLDYVIWYNETFHPANVPDIQLHDLLAWLRSVRQVASPERERLGDARGCHSLRDPQDASSSSRACRSYHPLG